MFLWWGWSGWGMRPPPRPALPARRVARRAAARHRAHGRRRRGARRRGLRGRRHVAHGPAAHGRRDARPAHADVGARGAAAQRERRHAGAVPPRPRGHGRAAVVDRGQHPPERAEQLLLLFRRQERTVARRPLTSRTPAHTPAQQTSATVPLWREGDWHARNQTRTCRCRRARPPGRGTSQSTGAPGPGLP